MRKRQRLWRTLGAGAAITGLILAANSAQGATSTRLEPGSAPGTVVTLVTGDRVTLSSDGRSQVLDPGPGRSDIGFLTERSDGHAYVIPSDAAELVADGRLDRRLFDVTSLMKQEYADDERADVPLIVSYGAVGDEAARSALSAADIETTRKLPSINGAAMEVTKSDAATGWAALRSTVRTHGIERIWLDGQRETLLDKSVPQIGAPDAWDAGYTGKGATVAVLDTGIDAEHPDLEGQVAGAKDFTGEGSGDTVGHGTHVASTIAGTAKASDGRYKGVAPDAKLLDGKVCASNGCTESAILDGMEWAAATKQADVINLSLGGTDTPETDPLEKAVNTLTEQTGALFVIAAGNSGPAPGTINSPSSADAALAVGAVTKQDNLASFSSRGPRVGDGGLKPDITAPGVAIAAARADGTQLGTPVGTDYTRASGTSMATPHVAGAAALLVQQRPTWRADQLKGALMGSAEPNPKLGAFEQGAGRVDLTNAIEQTVVSEPASMSFGLQTWPHDDDEPVTKSVTYQNNGDEDITLDLTADATDPDGQPAPDGMFTTSKDSVTIPAGGTASVEVTADTSVQSPDGRYEGVLSASAGELVVRTPIGVHKEVESYDLTLKSIGTNGKPSANAFATLHGLDNDTEVQLTDADGTAEIRLPEGRYLLNSNIVDSSTVSSLVQPTVELDKTLTIVADARKAKPISTTVENAKAELAIVGVSYDRYRESAGWLNLGVWMFNLDQVRTAQLGPDTSDDEMTSMVSTQWGKRNANGEFLNSPFTYALADAEQGGYFTGYDRTVVDSELARLQTSRNAHVDQRLGTASMAGWAPGARVATSFGFEYDLPTVSTHYVDAAPVEWGLEHREYEEDNSNIRLVMTLDGQRQQYRAGRTYKERWNAVVFGPSTALARAQRIENTIQVDVPMYSDADGHAGYSWIDTARTVLLRDGEQVAESGFDGYMWADVEPGKATYEIQSTADRSSVSTYSTKTEASWTFASDTAGQNGQPLPLWSARFEPNVDANNLNHDGRVSEVPVELETPNGAHVGNVTDLTVEVSTDDGKNWTTAEVTPDGANRYVATVKTPADATFVPLRSTVTDDMGNVADATIIRAYGLAR